MKCPTLPYIIQKGLNEDFGASLPVTTTCSKCQSPQQWQKPLHPCRNLQTTTRPGPESLPSSSIISHLSWWKYPPVQGHPITALRSRRLAAHVSVPYMGKWEANCCTGLLGGSLIP